MRNCIRHSIGIVAALLAALSVMSCELQTPESEKPTLMVSLYIPDAVITKAEMGKVNPLDDEKRITSLHVWVFLHSDGTLIGRKSFGAGLSNVGLVFNAITRFGLTIDDEELFDTLIGGATVDVYAVANMQSAGGVETREQLEALVLAGDEPSDFFGATTLTMSVPPEGLPMSGVLKNVVATGGYPVLNISTLTLKRAVSKIRFVFCQQETPATGSSLAVPTNTNCRIMGVSFDGITPRDDFQPDCQIAQREYVFTQNPFAISGYTPLAAELTGNPLISNNQLAFSEDPEEFCFRSAGHTGETLQEYENRLDELLEVTDKPHSQIGPIYVRETDKPISGVITYRIDDPEHPDNNPIKTASFSIGDEILSRNHSWIVYAYFAEDARTLKLTVSVLPWDWSEHTIDYTTGSVNVVRRFTIRETVPQTFKKRPDGDGHFDIFFWHTVEVNGVSKLDTLRGDIIIATPVGAELHVVPGPGYLAGCTPVLNAISISPTQALIYPNYNNPDKPGVIEDCKIEFEIICNPIYLADDDGNPETPRYYDTRYDAALNGNYIDLYFYIKIGDGSGERFVDLHSESIDYYRIYLWKDWTNPPENI